MKFEYIRDDGTSRYIDISLNKLPTPIPVDLILLDDTTLNSIFGHEAHSFSTSNWWVMKDGKINISLFHERYYFSHNWTIEPRTDYWLDGSYKTPMELVEAVHAKGCDVSKFIAQHHFYSDHECYFPVTSDFNEALKFCGYKYEGEGKTLDIAH